MTVARVTVKKGSKTDVSLDPLLTGQIFSSKACITRAEELIHLFEGATLCLWYLWKAVSYEISKSL